MKNKSISFGSALIDLLMLKVNNLGDGYKLRGRFIQFTLFAFIMIPGLIFSPNSSFIGAQLPAAPMLKLVGFFTEEKKQVGLKTTYYTLLTVEGGRVYRLSKYTTPGVVRTFSRKSPPEKIYTEGFILNNGNGSYFPLKIQDLNGRDVVSPQYLKKYLRIASNPLAIERVRPICYFLLFMLIVSIYFAVDFYMLINKDKNNA